MLTLRACGACKSWPSWRPNWTWKSLVPGVTKSAWIPLMESHLSRHVKSWTTWWSWPAFGPIWSFRAGVITRITRLTGESWGSRVTWVTYWSWRSRDGSWSPWPWKPWVPSGPVKASAPWRACVSPVPFISITSRPWLSPWTLLPRASRSAMRTSVSFQPFETNGSKPRLTTRTLGSFNALVSSKPWGPQNGGARKTHISLWTWLSILST